MITVLTLFLFSISRDILVFTIFFKSQHSTLGFGNINFHVDWNTLVMKQFNLNIGVLIIIYLS